MITHYLKAAVRSARRNKLTASINIIGLALAITCALLISLYLTDELTYDKHHANADRLYRVTRTFYNQNGEPSLKLANVAPPIGMLLKNDFLEIEKMFRTLSYNTTITLPEEGTEKKVFREPNIFVSEPDIINLLNVELTEGNPRTALEKPYSIMLSEPMAMKYFGTTQVQGKHLLVFSNRYDFEVSGVYKPFKAQTHFHPDFLISFSTLNDTLVYGRRDLETNWGNNAFGTYFLLKAGEDPNKLESKLPDFLDKHYGAFAIANGAPANFKASQTTSLQLQNIQDIHLKSHLDDELEPPGNITTVYLMGTIGVFIILIAAFNFINLSTAHASKRAKEVGVRKVAGAYRTQLIAQYLSESVLMALLGFVLAVGATYLAIDWLNGFLGKSIQLTSQWFLFAWAMVGALAVGLLAGTYPALVVSGFKPAVILKSQKSATKSWLRRTLVMAQFAISIGLIIATSVIFSQLDYLNKKDLGYNRDQIVRLPYYGQLLNESYDAFYNELIKNSAIVNATRSSRVPTGRLLDSSGAQIRKGDSTQAVNTRIAEVAADHEFFKTYQIPLVAGRPFSKEIKSDDTLAYIVNESAARAMGFEPDAIIDNEFTYGGTKGKIIGVAKDFHFESLHQTINPMVVHIPRSYYGNLSVQISGNNFSEGLGHLEKIWNTFLPGRLFEYTILNQSYARLYESEAKQSKLFTGFALLAIVIACLGLFGLATFNTLQRVKEIGIRKTLGASVSGILILLSREIVILVVIANVLAWPIAWFYMDKWLGTFAYRVNMGILIFIGAAVIAILIAFLTVSWQCFRAARTNPTEALRYE